jgi:hypothetical protein
MPRNILFKSQNNFKIFLIILNLIFWILFWIVFFFAACPYQSEPTGEYDKTIVTVIGRSVTLEESKSVNSFWNSGIVLEFPSFMVASLIARMIDPQFAGDNVFMKTSESAWIVILAMCLSFLQWYFVGSLIQYLVKRKRDDSVF